MADVVKVRGMKQLGDAIRLVQDNMQRKILAAAMRKGSKVLEKGVNRRAPRDTGELAKNVDAKLIYHPDKGSAVALIGIVYHKIVAAGTRRLTKRGVPAAPSSEDPAVYARFNEFGRPNLRGHTHQAKHPFMRPTFDEDSDKALQAFADEVKKRLGDLVS